MPAKSAKPLPKQEAYVKHCTGGGPPVDDLGYATQANAPQPSAAEARLADDRCELKKYGHVATMRDRHHY